MRLVPPRRPGLAVALPLALSGSVLMAALASGALSGTPQDPAPSPQQPVFTQASGMTLRDLEAALGSGTVDAVTAAPLPAGGAPGLVARRTDGSVVPVRLVVPAAEAVRALAAAGYEDALTSEALDVAALDGAQSGTVGGAARGAAPGTTGGAGEPDPVAASGAPDPVRSAAAAVAMPLALLALLCLAVWLFSRGALARSMGRGARSTTFAVVMPGVSSRTAAGPAAVSGSTAPARAQDGSRLADVAGCDEAKGELVEVVEFLRQPERFVRMGAVLPRGVLLYGPPGTGKTMLARAVAAEAGVPFLHVSGSEFVEMYVGVGARRVRDLFAQARKLGRAVIFVDEFDALAKARGGPGAHDEREQTLNQLLVELDGFTPAENIVVMAATNRLDVLDLAVLRPGRFGRKVHVGLPDVRGRREILDVHAVRKPLDPEADLEALARKTYGFSGAQLADILNEAAILAARRDAPLIGSSDLQGGWLKVAVGTGRRRSMEDRERAIIAAHEVGHAICGRVHGDRRRVEEISLFAHGDALGVTVSSSEDNDLPSESDLRARLVALMGGRAAEEICFQEVTGGASSDFEKATAIATTMVTRFGMGSDPDGVEGGPSGRGVLSLLVPRQGASLPSEVQAAATRAVRAILDRAYADACTTLEAQLPLLRRISAHLVDEERIDGDTFDALFDGRLEAPEPAGEWRPEAARPRAWSEVTPFRERRTASRPFQAPADPDVAPPPPDDAPPPVAAGLSPEGEGSGGDRRGNQPRREGETAAAGTSVAPEG